jgi:hypothetical protein
MLALRAGDPRAEGVEQGRRRPPPLLEGAPGSDEGCPVKDASSPTLGDLVIVLLASTLAGLRDRLESDGFAGPAELVADLVDIVDDYIMRLES